MSIIYFHDIFYIKHILIRIIQKYQELFIAKSMHYSLMNKYENKLFFAFNLNSKIQLNGSDGKFDLITCR